MASRLPSALAIPLAALTLLPLAPAAQGADATQTFYLAPENNLSLKPVEALEEPVSSGLAVCAGACVRHESETAWHSVYLKNGGSVAPVRSLFWIEARDTTVVSPVSLPDVDGCPINVYLDLVTGDNTFVGGWSYCVGFDGVTFEGLQEVDLDWSWASAVNAAPGTFLRLSIWTRASSSGTPERQTLYVVSDAEHKSSIGMAGTSEPMPPPDRPTGTSNQNQTRTETRTSTTSASKAPTSTPTSRATTTVPTSEATTASSEPPLHADPTPPPAAAQAPAAGILLAVGLVAGAAAIRRRL